MQGIFHPHPFSTPVGLLTERATDSGQLSEDWSLILEVCDNINESNEGPKEAVRAIRKRVTSSAGRDHVCIWYTLLLLEACVKNCGRRFHSQIASKEFLHDFLKILSPKNEPSQELQNKVLYMLKSWVECNWDVPGRRDLEKVYNTLLRKGIQFPNAAPDGPIHVTVEKPSNGACTHPLPTVNGPSSSSFRSKNASCRPSVQTTTPHSHSVAAITTPRHLCNVCHTQHTSTGPDSHSCSPSSRYNRSPCSYVHSVRIHTTEGTRQPSCINRVLHCSRPFHSTASSRYISDGVLVHSVPNSLAGALHTCRPTSPASPDRMEFDLDGTVRHLTSAQRVKLMQDLSVVETNVNLLNDMLAELRPDTIGMDDLILLQELHQTCRTMHLRVMEFLGQVSDEEATPALLHVNDNLNSAFMRYERFERYRSHSVLSESVSPCALDANNTRSGPLSITCSREGPLLALTSTQSHGSSFPSTRLNQPDDDDDPLLDVAGMAEQRDRNDISHTDGASDRMFDRQLVPVLSASSRRVVNELHRTLDHVAQDIDRLALVQASELPRNPSICVGRKQRFCATNSTAPVSIEDAQSATLSSPRFVVASTSSAINGDSSLEPTVPANLLLF